MPIESRSQNLSTLSDQELVSALEALLRSQHRLTASIILHLMEVEDRRLHLRAACSSLFAYCIELGFTEDEACRRINAARLARRFPAIIGRLESGELSLSGLSRLKPHLTDDNATELLDAACNKTVAGVEQMIAARFPKPDVPSTIRKLPDFSSQVAAHSATPPQASLRIEQPAPAVAPERTPESTQSAVSPTPRAAPLLPQSRPADRGRIVPLSETRSKVTFTASKELREKLELARDLMRHQNPSGDFAPVFERALELLIAELMKKQFGQTTRPRKNGRKSARRGYVPKAERRKVLEQDGLGCSYTDEHGRRCGARAWIQLEHKTPSAKGGSSEADNLRLYCAEHNRLVAEEDFGRDFIDEKKRERKQRSRETKLTLRDGARPRWVSATGRIASSGRRGVVSRRRVDPRGGGRRRNANAASARKQPAHTKRQDSASARCVPRRLERASKT